MLCNFECVPEYQPSGPHPPPPSFNLQTVFKLPLYIPAVVEPPGKKAGFSLPSPCMVVLALIPSSLSI